jgi:hypothetical protein
MQVQLCRCWRRLLVLEAGTSRLANARSPTWAAVGYVGVGEVTGSLVALRDFEVEVDGHAVRLVDQPDLPTRFRARALSDDEETTEFAVPVRWLVAKPITEALSERGHFASRVTVCKLRDERTVEVVTEVFKLDSD